MRGAGPGNGHSTRAGHSRQPGAGEEEGPTVAELFCQQHQLSVQCCAHVVTGNWMLRCHDVRPRVRLQTAADSAATRPASADSDIMSNHER